MEYIYINGESRVAVETEGDNITKVFIDEVEQTTQLEGNEDKLQFTNETKRNKYKKFLNTQFENLIILTGAGSSVGIGTGYSKGRLLSQLWVDVQTAMGKDTLTEFCNLVQYEESEMNLEKLLSCANAAKRFITKKKGDEPIEDTIAKIEKVIKSKCELILPDNSPHIKFLEKITKRKVTLPRAKIFTLNYDTLFEQAGRLGNFSIIDGFSFTYPRTFSGRNFDYDIVQRDKSRVKEEDNFVKRVFHLYKPHGSVNWTKDKDGLIKQAENIDKALMIYPKDSKYENSYEQPFFEMMSRFQQNLRLNNLLLICIGFSFNDKHIVSAIQEALQQNPSFQLLVVNKGIDNSMAWLTKIAKEHTNVVLVDELFEDFAKYYPDLKSYNQDEYKKITINLGDSENE